LHDIFCNWLRVCFPSSEPKSGGISAILNTICRKSINAER